VTDTAIPAPTPAPKADPETLVLRGSPGRVTRFRRGAIIGIAAAGSTALVAVAWLALKPASFSLVAAGEDRRQMGAAAPPDALAGAPRSYGDVPQLGPPLPGDLGRPILEHQRQTGAAPGVIASDPAAEAAQRAAQAAEAERQRIAAEQRTARESGVMMQLASAARAGALASGEQPAAGASATGQGRDPSRIALDPERDPNNQQRRQDFVARPDTGGDVNPHVLVRAPSPYTLSAGSIIAASLITGLNSDLPGMVTAQVSENAYDSVSGRILLIPQGSRLIGSYDSVVAFGQSRALVVWQRIILPDGSSIRIDNVPATDMAGYAGLSDRIDRHTWQLLKGVALSTLLGVGMELSFGSSESDLVRAIRESAQQSGARTGDQLVTRNLNVQPTLRVRPGWPLRVVIHRDIVLPRGWSGQRG
jgi:type IV secretory pathway VirB10-like protein